jgi:hypothetical protein
MAFRFVLFLVSHFFLRMSHFLFPLAFDLLTSLRARPMLPLLRAFPFTKIRTFACRSELLLLTTSLMGFNAAALSTDSAGPGL